MKQIIYIILSLLLVTTLNAQMTQNIRGKVTDNNLCLPLVGATVLVNGSEPIIAAITGSEGEFTLSEVPVGRVSLSVRYIGYFSKEISDVLVNSGKELILQIQLEEKLTELNEIVIKAQIEKDKALNDMALISARTFSIEETDRYAGVWGDPARLATNFAGVTNGTDMLNDIVIRGNSPAGLLWRLDGIEIPNPNHFGFMGASGGTVSILNNNVMSNSDFFTSAFPAEYGNALSGVFDINLKTGNNHKREHVAQMGFNGVEFGLEGPFNSSSNATYIANYRCSQLALFDAIGLDMGIGAVPYYQDLSFKLNFPRKNKSNLSIIGLGGLNHLNLVDDETTGVYEEEKFATKMGVLGINYTKFFSNKLRLRTSLSTSYQEDVVYDYSSAENVLTSSFGNEFTESSITAGTEARYKANSRNTFELGVNYKQTYADYIDSVYVKTINRHIRNFNINGSMGMLQNHVQWLHRFSPGLKANIGIHYQYLTMNKDASIEPRLSVDWSFSPGQSVALGYGMHSQAQPRLVYFQETLVDTVNNRYTRSNKNLEFSKSHHFSLGYNLSLGENTRLKAETYYQHLYNIPIDEDKPYISTINGGMNFTRTKISNLVNKGAGYNYGVELTLEKFLSNNYYYLLTTSLFDSKYKDTNDKIRNTAYNANYVVNVLGGYEIPFKNQNSLLFDIKATFAGGKRILDIDEQASITEGNTIYDYSNAYENKSEDYFRIDLRITYKKNSKNTTQEFGINIQNLTNRQNIFFEEYNSATREIDKKGNMGIVPAMLWRINF